MTRGRTGSTSVINELGKLKNVLTMQELFIHGIQFTDENINNWYSTFPPYDHWLKNNYKKPWYTYLRYSKIDNILAARKYLENAEKIAEEMNSECFGYKVLSHHFAQRKYLRALIKERGYIIIYLKRNIALQVISGIIAKKRGIYNSMATYSDDNQYEIDISLFKKLVNNEKLSVESDLLKLAKDKDEFVTVSYEDYCDNKILFYSEISNFLNHKLDIPPPSNTQIMILNIKETVKNYNEVKEVAADLGFNM